MFGPVLVKLKRAPVWMCPKHGGKRVLQRWVAMMKFPGDEQD
jgi:hypothetical protein